MTIIIFILILAILVLVHEFGHFIIAKKNGIRVDEFGLGFPPRLFSFKPKESETTYSVNAIPLGGFVKIFGEDSEESSIDGPDSARSFINKPKSVQASVLVGGVLFNILFAWLLFSFGFSIGMPYETNGRYTDRVSKSAITITSVLGSSPAEESGFKVGDKILKLDNLDTVSSDSIRENIIASDGERLNFIVKREGIEVGISVVPEVGVVGDKYALGIGMSQIGTLKLPVHLAVWEGLRLSGEMIKDVAVGFSTFLYQAVTGKANFSGISGPVGIVGLIGDASTLGFLHLLFFTAFISINLAVLNMIPFPALDGGRLLFILIEKIKGSPINPKVAGTLNFIGFALLLILLVVVTFNDILRLF